MKFDRYLKVFLILLFAGLVLRTLFIEKRFYFGHDHDLALWFVRDVIQNGHLRLIGQQTSTEGIFIGPLYYYLLIPFVMIGGFSALGLVAATIFIGIFGIWSSYYVFSRILDNKAGLIGSLVYSLSQFSVNNDTEAYPTSAVIIWSIWLIYALYLFVKKKEINKALIISAILVGLIWHLNFALILTVPLLVYGIYLNHKKLNARSTVYSFILFLALLSPFFLFELKHGFLQTNSLIASLTTDQGDIVYSGGKKLLRVYKITNQTLFSLIGIVPASALLYLGVPALLFILYKKLPKQYFALFSVWYFLYIAFFSLYSKTVSEYYLHGLFGLYLLGFVVFLRQTLRFQKIIFTLLIAGFVFINYSKLDPLNTNRQGFYYRKEVVENIADHADKEGYDCIAVSYLVDPGYDLGWRYFFLKNDLSLRPVSNKVPVYSIVFPLKDYYEIDEFVGSYGIIYPDALEQLDCSGDNINLTLPMWGLPT